MTDQVRRLAVGGDPLTVASGLVTSVARACGLDLPGDLLVDDVDPVASLAALELGDVEPADGARLLGELYEAALSDGARGAGSHYTPADVARRLVEVAFGGWVAVDEMPAPRPRVWDPSCGAGAFLLAAADAMVAAGGDPGTIVRAQLWGTDLDPAAVAVAEAALWMWAAAHDVDAAPGDHLAVADPLLQGRGSDRRGEVGGSDPSIAPPLPWPVGGTADGASADEGGATEVPMPLRVAAEPGFDLVVGNPPFQGQLRGTNVRSPEDLARLRDRWGHHVVRPYTDTSALFLVAGIHALRPGGRLALVLPTSVLAARDAAGARAEVAAVGELRGLWVAAEPIFDAAVDVCAVVVERSQEQAASSSERSRAGPGPESEAEDQAEQPGPRVRRWAGRTVRELAPAGMGTISTTDRAMGVVSPSWAPLALAALGIPDPAIRTAGCLGDIATARAGFRDEYYGLVGHVHEASPGDDEADADWVERLPPGFAPLVTTGLIDPGRLAWDRGPVRFAGEHFLRPVVDLSSLEQAGGRAAAWVRTTSVPKVVVATQTRVGEAAVDETGPWVASTPAVVVLADPSRLWAFAAVICSPVGSVAALAASAGAARAGGAIRQSVSTVASLPLPIDRQAWDAGAVALRAQDRPAFLEAMAAAYEVSRPAELDHWWSSRSPWRG